MIIEASIYDYVKKTVVFSTRQHSIMLSALYAIARLSVSPSVRPLRSVRQTGGSIENG